MKITIRTEASLEETKVEIVCRELTQEVEELLATIRMMNQQITAEWISAEPVLVIAGNMILAVVLFAVFYRRTGLE